MGKHKREKSGKYPGVYFRWDADKKDRMFYIIYRKGGRDSKVIEEPVGRASAAMTEAKASLIRADRMRGREQTNTERRQALREIKKQQAVLMTLDKIWTEYQEAHPEHKSRAKDVSRYNVHIAPHFGNMSPKDMRTKDIDDFKKKSLEKGSSPGTIQRVISQLRAIINFGVKRGYCPSLNPAELVIESISVDNKKTEMLTAEELIRLKEALDAEKDQDAAALIRLALVTGMRKGALLGLKWTDCDFENNIIILQGESAKSGYTAHIPMNQAAKEILQSITRSGSEYVFPGRDGGKRKDYRRIARRVKERAGLPADFRPLHGLRHHFASFLASSGEVDLYTLQKLLTHASPQMTQRYAHLADEALKKASDVACGLIIKDKG